MAVSTSVKRLRRAAAGLLLSAALSLSAALTAAAAGPGELVQREAVLQQYAAQPAVHQLVLVKQVQGSDALVDYYVKAEDGSWNLQFETDGLLGGNGIGKLKEGDCNTPFGDYGISGAFGLAEDPGTKLSYIPVKDTTYACDEPGPYYDRIIDTAETGHDCRGESMAACRLEYRYGIVIDYNPAHIYPRGSAIFLHCKGENPATHGCIAIDEARMVEILRTADPGLRIVIGVY